MASSKALSSSSLIFLINLLFCTLISSVHVESCPTTPHCKTHTTPSPKPRPAPSCPCDISKLGACTNVLGGVINMPNTACCGVFKDLSNAEAALCVCTAMKSNILGVNINIPFSLSLILNFCGKKVPAGYLCV